MTADFIVFDCDGVLVDSEPIIHRAHAEVLTASGYPITEADLVERFLGVSDSEMIEMIERERGGPLPFTYAVRVGEIAKEGFRQSLRMIPGVVDALDLLPLETCVASSGALDQIRRKFELTGLLPRFEEIIQRGDGGARQAGSRPIFLRGP